MQRACAPIHEEAQADPEKRGMGTTAQRAPHPRARAASSRTSATAASTCCAAARVQQLTEDHTVFNELVKRGKLTREQIEKLAHKNAITRAVGVYERVEVDTLMSRSCPATSSSSLRRPHGYLETTAGARRRTSTKDGDSATKALIELANARGGKDNITAVLVRLGGEAERRRARQAPRAQARRPRAGCRSSRASTSASCSA